MMSEAFKVAEPHPEFRLNGLQLGNEDLADVAYSFIKEGEPYEKSMGSFLLDWLNSKDHIVAKTSGSTGPPKDIEIKKQFMINSAQATGKFFNLPEGTSALHCLPADFIAGKMMMVRAMVLGWKIDLVCPRVQCLEEVHRQYDFSAITPFQLKASLPNLHLIRKIIVGGGTVSQNLRDLVRGMNSEIYETYGMTETVTHIAARKLNGKDQEDPMPFKVFPKVSISTDDRDCLVIKAPAISEDVIVTNDVVEILRPKEFIWNGRYDNVINSGGIKIFPEHIENKLQSIIPQRFFVGSLPDDELGDKMVLLVEGKSTAHGLEALEHEIRELRLLGKYEEPKKIFFIEKFVETENGKVNRRKTLEHIKEQ